jgi:hypothetical protein
MPDLNRALADIASIRDQLSTGIEFRGYGPATLAVTGGYAVAGGLVEAYLLPAENAPAAVLLWGGIALAAVLTIGVEMITRSRRLHSMLAEQMIRGAAAQFIPTGVAGLLLTAALYHAAPEALWLLPGLWQVMVGLGLFAACRFLPRIVSLAEYWYVGAGLCCVTLGPRGAGFSPWAMAVPFALGQILLAALLYHATPSGPRAGHG